MGAGLLELESRESLSHPSFCNKTDPSLPERGESVTYFFKNSYKEKFRWPHLPQASILEPFVLGKSFALTLIPPSAACATVFPKDVRDSCSLGGTLVSGQTKPLWQEKPSHEEVQIKPGSSRKL
jgi:hypothetical protein